MAQAWQAPSETFRRLAREGLEQYVTTLRRELADTPGMDQVKALLALEIAAILKRPVEQATLTPREEELALEAERELLSDERLYELEGEPRHGLKIADGVWMYNATCYLLIGGSEGELNISARVHGQMLDAIAIEPQGGFGGRIWEVVASALVGVPMEYETVKAPIDRFQKAGLIPEEINIEPLIKTIVKLGK